MEAEKTANICARSGPSVSLAENRRNNFPWLLKPLEQALQAAAPMAGFTLSGGLHRNRRVVSPDNQVLAQACLSPEVLEVTLASEKLKDVVPPS